MKDFILICREMGKHCRVLSSGHGRVWAEAAPEWSGVKWGWPGSKLRNNSSNGCPWFGLGWRWREGI